MSLKKSVNYLYVDMKDTGIFRGSIKVTLNKTKKDDTELTVKKDAAVHLLYSDAGDLTEMIEIQSTVDPFGTIFDSETRRRP